MLEKEKIVFAQACRDAGAHGLMLCSSGNMSWRVDAKRVLVSASRSWMARLTEENVTVCRLSDGEVLEGQPASVETRFHLGILRGRPEVGCVLHFQAPHATTLCCSDAEVDYNVIPEVPYYIGAVGQVGYLRPGSEELAEATVEIMQNHDLAQLANHGQVTVGKDMDEAIQRAVFFELACRVWLSAGDTVRPLTSDAAAWLREASQSGGYKAHGT